MRKFPLVPDAAAGSLNLGITLPPAQSAAEPCPDCPPCPPPSGDCTIGPLAVLFLNLSPGTVAPAACVYCPGLGATDTIVWTPSNIVTDGTIKYMNTFGTTTSAKVLVLYIDSPTTTGSITLSANVNGTDVGSVDVNIA